MNNLNGYNSSIEAWRCVEYPALQDKIYLDHGGTTLYAKSMLQAITEDLVSNLYGKPHSASTPSALSSKRVEAVRKRVLSFLKADPAKFDVVFVPNTTAAVKLVADSFRDLAASSDTPGNPFWYFYHKDCHTSLVGVREFANAQHRCFHDDSEVERWIDNGGSPNEDPSSSATKLSLFAYPGQSNMTGRRLPLTWPGKLRKSKLGNHTYSLLDVAALATTTQIDLSDDETAPDFTTLSFYKIFGFPDLGALIVRKDSAHILQWRKYFGGGTVDMIICVKEAWHARKDYATNEHYDIHDQLEDGTLPFHSIIALDVALDTHERLFGSMQKISLHTCFLTKRLFDTLSMMRYKNGQTLCHIYSDDPAAFGDSKKQGSTLAFNVFQSDGSLIPYSDVEDLAGSAGIYVRSGGLCNPGGIATYLHLEPWEMKRAYSGGHRCGHATQIVSGKPTGVVRVSLGAMSITSDVDKFLDFMATFLDTQSKTVQKVDLVLSKSEAEVLTVAGREPSNSAMKFFLKSRYFRSRRRM